VTKEIKKREGLQGAVDHIYNSNCSGSRDWEDHSLKSKLAQAKSQRDSISVSKPGGEVACIFGPRYKGGLSRKIMV
jgi:hypothetical protein